MSDEGEENEDYRTVIAASTYQDKEMLLLMDMKRWGERMPIGRVRVERKEGEG